VIGPRRLDRSFVAVQQFIDVFLPTVGLDSLMGVEIENSLEAAIGVALPPTSLMRARTIGQIASLIAGYMGGKAATPAPVTAAPVEASVSEDVDLEALSDEDIDRLLGADANASEVPNS